MIIYEYPKNRYRKYAEYRLAIDHHIGRIVGIDVEQHLDGDDIFIMRFANHKYKSSIDAIKKSNMEAKTLKLEDCPVLKTRS